jgi:anti-sigma-K factor RskA
MMPLEPNDPLWDLLGKARQADTRPSFTADVMRQVRQTPQEKSWLTRLKVWWIGEEESVQWARPALALAAVAVLGMAWTFTNDQPAAPMIVAETPVQNLNAQLVLEEETSSPWKTRPCSPMRK